MQCDDRLESVSGAQSRRELWLNGLTHLPMPHWRDWGHLGSVGLILGPSRGGEVAIFDNRRRKEEKKTGGGYEEEDEAVKGWGRKKETTMKATTTTTSQP